MKRDRTLMWVMCLGALAFLLWTLFFRIDVAAVMMGEVVPSGRVKHVQHLEGGIVSNILVREGEFVETGQALIELSSASPDADVNELELRLKSLDMDVLRLQSLLDGQGKIVIPETEDKNSESVRSAGELFRRQWDNYQARLREQNQQLQLRKVEQDAEIIKVRNLKPRLGYIQEQIKINENLMRDGLANRFEHLDLLKEANSIESEIDNSKVNLQRINVILEKEQTVLQGIVNDQQEQWNRELISARKMLAELTSRMDKFVDSQARTVVRAPANGTIFNLFVHNPGAVIPPGGHVLTIVPEDETMLIEAKMMVADVGYVKKGQAVRLQLANDASAGFQPVNGSVVYISADAVSEQNKPPYYLVRIRPDTPVFSNGHQTYPLVPGVVVQANVIVGERSLFKYFVNPVFQGFSSAFSER